MAVIGNTGVILTGISTRYKEFGIYFAMGLTRRNHIIMMIGETGCLYAAAFLIATCVGYLLSTFCIENIFIVNIYSIALSFGIAILCLLVCVILPLLKISKLEPNELIRGSE